MVVLLPILIINFGLLCSSKGRLFFWQHDYVRSVLIHGEMTIFCGTSPNWLEMFCMKSRWLEMPMNENRDNISKQKSLSASDPFLCWKTDR
jgi:hypothetical protein